MTNAPFRAAFWTMCCAFVLSTAMIASSPEAGRFVTRLVHPELTDRAAGVAIPEVVLGHHERLHFPGVLQELETHIPVPNPYSEPTGLPAEVSQAESRWPANYSPPPTSGLRVASADPSIVLGMIEQQSPSKASQKATLANDPVTTPPIAVVTSPEASARNIPVPAPEFPAKMPSSLLNQQGFPEPELKRLQGSVTELHVAQIERELAEARSNERGKLQKIASGELTRIEGQLQDFRHRFIPESEQTAIAANHLPSAALTKLASTGEASKMLPHEEPSTESASLVDLTDDTTEPQITISETAEAGRFDVSIRDMDVAEVFRQLGRKLDWRVIVAPGVSGRFSGEFHEADIEQVFVMVVKTHKLGVDRRGDYILIREHSGHPTR